LAGVNGVTIRPVARHEHQLAGGLVVDAYRTLGDARDAYYEAVLRDVAGRVESGSVLVAEVDGRIVGTVTVSFGETDLSQVDDPDAATIRMLGVSSEARGRGVGEALVRRCIEAARAHGCRRIRLDTRTSMAAAHRLYERLGFRRDAHHDWSPAPGIQLLAYVLDL
jgi:ribosomal protein S18 acetylase RimI-like enzyme